MSAKDVMLSTEVQSALLKTINQIGNIFSAWQLLLENKQTIKYYFRCFNRMNLKLKMSRLTSLKQTTETHTILAKGFSKP